jgi:hypothetical protein
MRSASVTRPLPDKPNLTENGVILANKYGDVAVMVAGQTNSDEWQPKEQWESAAATLFPNSPTSQRKACPKGAFLGLCEEGLVRGIPPGRYTSSKDNKGYAIRAVKLLRDGHASTQPQELWSAVVNGAQKAHNSQMDVVIALWEHGFIDHNPIQT